MKCLVMVVSVVLAFAAAAQGPQGEKKPSGSPRGGQQMAIEPLVKLVCNPKMAEKLGVTDEQVEKLKAFSKEKGSNKELNEKIRKGMGRQAELLKAEKIDEAAVMAALDEVWEARKEVAKRQTKRLIALKSILTDEQINKAREALKTVQAERQAKAKAEKGTKAAKKDKGVKAPKAEKAEKASDDED